MAQGRLNDMVFVKYNRALDRRCKRIDTANPIILKDINETSGASEPAYPTRASTSRCSVEGSTSTLKGKGAAHTSTSGFKAHGLIDEDCEEDIGLSEDDEVDEKLGIDVDDNEDDENDF
ncbi:hypothetical protein Tco_1141886 [Tanacetum coccineum]